MSSVSPAKSSWPKSASLDGVTGMDSLDMQTEVARRVDIAESAAARHKLSRRSSSPLPVRSAWQQRQLWLAPLFSELVLLVGAIWLSSVLQRIITTVDSAFPLLVFMLLAGVYVAVSRYSRNHELVMPRIVVLFGVGGFALVALTTLVWFAFLDIFVSGANWREWMSGLGLLPIIFFLLRCHFLFRAARYTPSLRTLQWRVTARAEKEQSVSKCIRFWLN